MNNQVATLGRTPRSPRPAFACHWLQHRQRGSVKGWVWHRCTSWGKHDFTVALELKGLRFSGCLLSPSRPRSEFIKIGCELGEARFRSRRRFTFFWMPSFSITTNIRIHENWLFQIPLEGFADPKPGGSEHRVLSFTVFTRPAKLKVL